MKQAIDILIVDDDEKTARRLQRSLRSKENIHQADCARTVPEALGLLKAMPYDVVVLDLVMAPYDGFTLLERIAREKTESSPDVMIVSAINQEEIIKKCFGLGAKYYMIKPFQDEIVYRRIWDVVRLREQEETRSTVYVRNPDGIEQRIADLFLKIGVP
jgi:two-component system response regulator (stage 0 sporulation protein A)